jgi:NAD(P)-dependent dehydrogenase (short-subunit alcohol dehydrogenase family)
MTQSSLPPAPLPLAPLPLEGQIALVTGATRGIGEAAALALAEQGAHIIAIGRTQGALTSLDDKIRALGREAATLVPLDLKEPDSLDVLGAHLFERFGRLDLLVHAAAVLGPLTPASHMTPGSWAEGIAVNLTATWRIIRSFEPLLKASPAARAMFLTSSRAKRPKAFWGLYAATKAGMESLVGCWADEVENTSIRAVLVDPGQMRTRMRAQAYPGETPDMVPAPSEVGPLIVALAQADLPVSVACADMTTFRKTGQLFATN